MDIADAIHECAATAKEKGFHRAHTDMEGWRSSQFAKLALIHSEISEATEALRDAVLEDDLWECSVSLHNPGKLEGYLTELADAVIRIFDLVGEQDMEEDFEAILAQKMAYNSTRPPLHGRQA